MFPITLFFPSSTPPLFLPHSSLVPFSLSLFLCSDVTPAVKVHPKSSAAHGSAPLAPVQALSPLAPEQVLKADEVSSQSMCCDPQSYWSRGKERWALGTALSPKFLHDFGSCHDEVFIVILLNISGMLEERGHVRPGTNCCCQTLIA